MKLVAFKDDLIQYLPLNSITLGQHKSDNNKRLIQLTGLGVQFGFIKISNSWLQKVADSIVDDPIKRRELYCNFRIFDVLWIKEESVRNKNWFAFRSRKDKTSPALDRFHYSSRVIFLICINLLKISSVDFVQKCAKIWKSMQKSATVCKSMQKMQSVLKYVYFKKYVLN